MHFTLCLSSAVSILTHGTSFVLQESACFAFHSITIEDWGSTTAVQYIFRASVAVLTFPQFLFLYCCCWCVQASVWKSARLKSWNNVGADRLKCHNETLCFMGRKGKEKLTQTAVLNPMGCDSDFSTSAGASWIHHQEQVLWKNVRPSQLQSRKLLASLAGNEVCIDRPAVDSYFWLRPVRLLQSHCEVFV